MVKSRAWVTSKRFALNDWDMFGSIADIIIMTMQAGTSLYLGRTTTAAFKFVRQWLVFILKLSKRVRKRTI